MWCGVSDLIYCVDSKDGYDELNVYLVETYNG